MEKTSYRKGTLYGITVSDGDFSRYIPVVGALFKDSNLISISYIKTKSTKSAINSLMSSARSLKIDSSGTSSIKLQCNGPTMSLNSEISIESLHESSLVTYFSTKDSLNIILFKEAPTEEAITSDIIQRLKSQSPIPIPEEFLPAVAKSVGELASPIEVIESDIFTVHSAFYLDINSPECDYAIREQLVKSYSEKQFMDEFKFVPKITSLLSMIDPKRLNRKTWVTILDFFKERHDGATFDQVLSASDQKNFVHAYEVFGVDTIKLYKNFESKGINFSSMPFVEAAVGQVKYNFSFDRNKFLKILMKCETQMEFLIIISSLGSSYFVDHLEGQLKSDSKNKLLDLARNIPATSIRAGCEIIYQYGASLGLTPFLLKDYQEAYLSAMQLGINTPLSFPTVEGSLDNDYSWDSLDMRSPAAWFAGLETNCCQHLHGAAESTVLFAARNIQFSGIFRVKKKGKVVAQSLFWYNQKNGDFVFDSIETLDGVINHGVLGCLDQFIGELLKRRPLFGFYRILCGSHPTLPDGKVFAKTNSTSHISEMPHGYNVYTDAKSLYEIKTLRYT